MNAYCMLCGKTFTGDDTECGGMYNGSPLCNPDRPDHIVYLHDMQQHDSDCAVHNEPAYPKGACDCSLSKQEKGD